MRLRASLVFVFGSLAALAVAACSGGGGSSGYPAPLHPSPNVASAAPAPSPVVNQSVAVAQVNNAPLAVKPPAPAGYTSSLNVPNATVPAGTTVTVNSSTTIPANSSIPPLAARRRGSASTRAPQANTQLTTIFFDSLQPSNSITVAGSISASQAFPAGILVASTTYYLGFYDSTAQSPAWQTIAQATPQPDGQTLVFSGMAESTTLLAGDTYGFAIFTAPAGGASSTPLPAPTLNAYLPQGSAGIVVVNAAGVTSTTLPITANSLGLDDSGNVYALNANLGASPSPVPAVLAEYGPGGASVVKSFAPSQPYNTVFDVTSGAGLLAAFGSPQAGSTSPTGMSQSTDIWLPSSTGGAPSYTINEPSAGVPFGIVDHAGNVYLTHVNADGTFNYDVYYPGSTTPNFTIPETIVPSSMQAQFNPNYAAVGSDGTLYVTEYDFTVFNGVSDQLAGLYIYKPTSNGSTTYTESFVATTSNANGAGPEGVDVDANNNIYVANNNQASMFDANGNYLGTQDDSLHDITIYGPGGTSPRHVTNAAIDPAPVAVAADGTLFFSSFGNPDGTDTAASYSLLPQATTFTKVSSYPSELFALYDGTRETTGVVRKNTASHGAANGSTHTGAGPHVHARVQARIAAARRAFLKRLSKVQ